MELKSKYFKILTSIFILLFFIVFLSPFSFATEDDFTEYFGGDFPSNFTQFLYDRLVENYSTQLNSYDYCIALCYEGYGSSSSNYGGFYVYFTNDSTLNFTSGTYNSSGYLMNFGSTNISGEMVKVYISMGRPSYTDYSIDYKYTLYGFNHASNVPDGQNITKRLHFYKGENNITLDSNVYLYKSLPSYDFSFVIKDKSTSTEHSFDFNFIDCEFNDGRSFVADVLTSGHYIVSVNNLVHNVYTFTDNTSDDTYWVSGFIDYVDFSDTLDSKTQFYWSSGYNIPKVLNETNNPIKVYRFYFKGYSNDSFGYEELSETSNCVAMKFDNEYMLDYNYSYPSGTFAYSNRDIYYGIDSSLYGFNGLSSQKFFDESLYSTLEVTDITKRDYVSDSSYVDNQVTTFAINNDTYSYPSSYVDLSSNSLKDFSGVDIDSISPYGSIVDYTGNKETGVDTSNWGVLDYVKHIPEVISNLPKLFEGLFKKLATPNTREIFAKFDELNEFFLTHFGSFYQPVDYIVGVLKTLMEKYTPAYSNYPFTIPGIRWYNPITQEKQVLVESQTIDLLNYFADDDDWLHFWSTLRYLTSFIIYINLIVMLYNKLRWLIGEGSIDLMKVSSQVGNLGRNLNNNVNKGD